MDATILLMHITTSYGIIVFLHFYTDAQDICQTTYGACESDDDCCEHYICTYDIFKTRPSCHVDDWELESRQAPRAGGVVIKQRSGRSNLVQRAKGKKKKSPPPKKKPKAKAPKTTRRPAVTTTTETARKPQSRQNDDAEVIKKEKSVPLRPDIDVTKLATESESSYTLPSKKYLYTDMTGENARIISESSYF